VIHSVEELTVFVCCGWLYCSFDPLCGGGFSMSLVVAPAQAQKARLVMLGKTVSAYACEAER